MAIIPLRAYNRDIEGLIENGQLDEAVAHCRHILATYPKHIATYRLLGKAHLEQQRISDATDIFQRVLSTIPDDFIANVGMSIIREDENNLDASIWHMELAYEAQPSNVAIQDELRRLYGRRDGMQPPKVRLTRGALARMYAKGGLIEQATAELRSAIAEDPNRPDLQLLLADMFFQNGQRIEAVEICANILKKLPFCLAANQLLAVCLPDSEGSDQRKNYRQVAVAMDPYYAFASQDAITSDQVPENAVNIEKLEWKSGIQAPQTPAQPAWATSLGIALAEPKEEKVPDWLKEADTPIQAEISGTEQSSVSPFIWDTQEVEKIITDASEPTGEIPDWMKDAGWEPASPDSAQQVEAPTEAISEEGLPQEDLAKADMPDWLKGIAPMGIIEEKLDESQPAASDTTLPWLEQQRPGPTDSIIQWLEGKEPDQPVAPPVPEVLPIESTEEVPDWLKDLDLPYPPEVPADTGGALPATPAFIEEPASVEDAAQAGEVEPSLQEFLNQIDETEPTRVAPVESAFPEEVKTEQLPSAFTEDLPDWIKELAGEMPEPSGDAVAESELQAEVPAFLDEMPEVETPPSEMETMVPAEMLAAAVLPQFEEQAPVEPAVSEEEVPSGEDSSHAGTAMAAAFLAGMAINDEEKEEPTAPVEEVTPEPGAWVKLEAVTAAQEITASLEPQDGEQAALPEMEIQPEEVSSIQAADIPEWIKGLGETPEIVPGEAEPDQAVVPETEIPHAEELPAWLLDFEQPAEEEAAAAETPVPEALEWKEEELPDWIKELTATAPSEASPAPLEAEPGLVSAETEITSTEGELPSIPPGTATWIAEPEETEEEESILSGLAAAAAVTRILSSDENKEEVQEVPSVEQPMTPLAESVDTQVPVVAAGVSALVSEEPAAFEEQAVEPPFFEVEETGAVESADMQIPSLEDARNAVNQGATQEAVEKYNELIRKNLHLEEVIKDLQDALYRHPVDVNLWVALGDAYTHTDNLQEALSTLSKAEDLVR